jgi:hypothetical protein
LLLLLLGWLLLLLLLSLQQLLLLLLWSLPRPVGPGRGAAHGCALSCCCKWSYVARQLLQ